MANPTGIGASILRREDKRFLTGRGNYVADLKRPGQTAGVFVRSPHAHARLRGIDTGPALAIPGVITVLTGADLVADGVGGMPVGWGITGKDGLPMKEPPHPAMAHDKVRHVGDAVAFVVAETLERARQGAEAVQIDYEVLPAVVGVLEAVRADAPQLFHDVPGNLCCDWEMGDRAATDAAFERAAHVARISLVNNRLIGSPMEPRAAVAEYESSTDRTTLWTTSQFPHVVRLLMGNFVLRIPQHKLRVVAPDVGGGFGVKQFHYAEEAVLTWAARRLGRPVKWVCDRSEGFLSDAQGRDHVSEAELALDETGKFLGLRVSTLANIGGYLDLCPEYPDQPLRTAAGRRLHHAGDLLRGEGGVHQHRPGGRLSRRRAPGSYLPAGATGRCGCLRPGNGPDRDPPPQHDPQGSLSVSDADGDPVQQWRSMGCMDRALEAADWAGFLARQAESAARGQLRGIGISTYVEACGLAPSRLAIKMGARGGLYESATVRVHPTGHVTVLIGTHSHGQGHETTFAQIVSEKLGIPAENVDIVFGDTDRVQFGMGTYGSRSLVVGGSALSKAANKVILKGRKIAAHQLEAALDDIVFEDGRFSVAGTDRSRAFEEICLSAYVPADFR